MSRPRRWAIAVLAASTLPLAACRGRDDSQPLLDPPVKLPLEQVTTTAGGTSIAGSAGPLPAVAVRDLGRGVDVDLAGLLPADRPLLVWFWAPY